MKDSLVSQSEEFYEQTERTCQPQRAVAPHCCLQKHENNSIIGAKMR